MKIMIKKSKFTKFKSTERLILQRSIHKMKRFTKIIAVVLAVIMLVCPIISCSSAGTPVLEYGKSKVTSNMYSYWLSRYKAMYLYTFTGMQDTAEFWSTEIASGYTAETYLGAIALQSVMTTLVCMEIYDSLGLKLSATQLDSIDQYIANLVTEHGEGSKSRFNNYASTYGVNDKILREIYIAEEKASQLYDYFYGENGIEKITDLHRDEYYKGSYAKVQLMILNNYEYVLDADGNYTYDENGTAQIQSLSDEALAEQKNKVAEIDTKLEEGTDFETLWNDYSDDKSYSNGYYLTSSTNLSSDILTAALTMEIGTVQKIESTYGTFYIKRYELDDKAYSDEKNADFFSTFDSSVTQSLFTAKIQGYFNDVTINQSELNKYSLSSSPVNYSF